MTEAVISALPNVDHDIKVDQETEADQETEECMALIERASPRICTLTLVGSTLASWAVFIGIGYLVVHVVRGLSALA